MNSKHWPLCFLIPKNLPKSIETYQKLKKITNRPMKSNENISDDLSLRHFADNLNIESLKTARR